MMRLEDVTPGAWILGAAGTYVTVVHRDTIINASIFNYMIVGRGIANWVERALDRTGVRV
jgi:hypothetical protein